MRTMIKLTIILVLVAACVVSPSPTAASPVDADRSAIPELLRKTWEKPQSQLVADPIVLTGNHAIADWRQGDHAGRALLRRASSGWSVVLCAGDALTEPAFLVEAGVAADQAATLADALASAERNLPADLKERMSRFKNIVRMHE